MKKGLVEMAFILDRSGSMSGLEKDTIGGFNSLIEKQKNEPGDAFVTTVLFDDQYELLYDHVDIKSVKPLTNKEYFPRGMTALLDAIGRTVNSIGKRLSDTPEDERPEQVIIAITTDGYENASHEFTKEKIKEMIEHQQSKYSWTFMFLGANMDAVDEASKIGIDKSFAKTYTNSAVGVDSVYTAMSCSMSVMRNCESFATTDDLGCDEAMVRSNCIARAKASASVALDDNVK